MSSFIYNSVKMNYGQVTNYPSGNTDIVHLLSLNDGISGANYYTDTSIQGITLYIDTQDALGLSAAKYYTDTQVTGSGSSFSTYILGYINDGDSAGLSAAKYYTDSELAGITTYINTQDAAGLSSANYYTDSSIAGITSYIDNGDAAGLSSANYYTDSSIAGITLYIDNGDAAGLSAANFYTDNTFNAGLTYLNGQIAAGLTSAKNYTDAQVTAGVSSANYYTDTQLQLGGDSFATYITGYIDDADVAGLSAANYYTDSSIAGITLYIDDGDAAGLSAANYHTDIGISGESYTRAVGDSLALYLANSYTNIQVSTITSQIGQVNGIATLDSNGKVPLSQMSVDVVVYQGTWNAETNTPVFEDNGVVAGTTSTQGYYWIVSNSGTTTVDGVTDWTVGDWIILSAAGTWEKVDNNNDTLRKSNNISRDSGTYTTTQFPNISLPVDNVNSHLYYADITVTAKEYEPGDSLSTIINNASFKFKTMFVKNKGATNVVQATDGNDDKIYLLNTGGGTYSDWDANIGVTGGNISITVTDRFDLGDTSATSVIDWKYDMELVQN